MNVPQTPRTTQRCLLVLAVAGSLISSGCSPVKGYPGPERPDEELSIFSSHVDTPRTVVLSSSVGENHLPRRGLALLPGIYRVMQQGAVYGIEHDCEYRTTFRENGLAYCHPYRHRGRWYRDCECNDYFVTIERCHEPVTEYNCSVRVDARAGHHYQLRMSATSEGNARGTVVDQLLGEPSTTMDCANGAPRNQVIERAIDNSWPFDRYGRCVGW